MGSYNVACSISNLSINFGEGVAFFPLINARKRGDRNLPMPGHLLIDANEMLAPFCLPIIGKYGDYGYVENVVKDSNTSAIENFFGMSIEAFLECVTCNRSPNDHYSSLFEYFTSPDDRKIVTDYTVKFDGKFLEKIGFVRLNIPGAAWYDYIYEDLPYIVKLVPVYGTDYMNTEDNGHRITSISFEMYDCNGELAKSRRLGYSDTKEQLISDYLELTGYHILCNKEDQWKVNLLDSMSGMFVHGDIWDYMASMYQGDSQRFIASYGEFRRDLEAYESKEPLYIDATAGTIGQQKRTYNSLCSMLGEEIAGKFNPRVPGSTYKKLIPLPDDPFDSVSSPNYFSRFIRNWHYFPDLYRSTIIKTADIRQNFIDFFNFYWEMYGNNKIFFPTLTGSQLGNNYASLRLTRAVTAILEKRFFERRPDETSPSNGELYFGGESV